MRASARARTILIILLILTSIMPIKDDGAEAESAMLSAILELDYESSKNFKIVFYLGVFNESPIKSWEEKMPVNDSQAMRSLWSSEWKNYRDRINNTANADTQIAVIRKIDDSVDAFIDNLLGIRHHTLIVKSIFVAHYPNGIRFILNTINKDGKLWIKPLAFIFESSLYEQFDRVMVKITSGMFVSMMADDFSISHYRALVFESTVYQKEAEITFYELPFISPAFMFILLFIGLSLTGMMMYDANQRVKKLKLKLLILLWVITSIIYILALIPYGYIMFYVFFITSFSIATVKFKRALKFEKPTKRKETYHHAMQMGVSPISARALTEPPTFEVADVKEFTPIYAEAPAKYFPERGYRPPEPKDYSKVWEVLSLYGDENKEFYGVPTPSDVYRELEKYGDELVIDDFGEVEKAETAETEEGVISLYDEAITKASDLEKKKGKGW